MYPGVYLGKMYAMPGTRMYGVLNVPADSAPVSEGLGGEAGDEGEV